MPIWYVFNVMKGSMQMAAFKETSSLCFIWSVKIKWQCRMQHLQRMTKELLKGFRLINPCWTVSWKQKQKNAADSHIVIQNILKVLLYSCRSCVLPSRQRRSCIRSCWTRVSSYSLWPPRGPTATWSRTSPTWRTSGKPCKGRPLRERCVSCGGGKCRRSTLLLAYCRRSWGPRESERGATSRDSADVSL